MFWWCCLHVVLAVNNYWIVDAGARQINRKNVFPNSWHAENETAKKFSFKLDLFSRSSPNTCFIHGPLIPAWQYLPAELLERSWTIGKWRDACRCELSLSLRYLLFPVGCDVLICVRAQLRFHTILESSNNIFFAITVHLDWVVFIIILS